MPLDKLSNAPEDCFVLDRENDIFSLKPEYEPYWAQEAFRKLVKDRTEFVLARYFMRARLQQVIFFHPSICIDGFKLNQKFINEFFTDNPPESGENRELKIVAGEKTYNVRLSRDMDENEYRISYKEDSRIARFFQSVFTPAPETGEKAFTLIADKKKLRLELPQKSVDLRGVVIDIPYAKNPDTGITARFRKLLKENPGQSQWELAFEKPGYGGLMEIEVVVGNAFKAWTGTKFRDKTRFPARIKASATALLHEGFRGEFHVAAKGKRVVISKA
jgi:hypothetical protein